MALAFFNLIPIIAGAIVCAYWIYALVTYDPNECPCDGDCENCMFTSDGCRWK